ncbi:hypothetical protein AVEN_261277-1 [Araneus ventricosus]|uniref:Uncharacterized protein n=1 Tax=Araneus ventricosus TaxID=182803 RepID=A0A4Y2GK48_ARAVE|nr:hypothetical protein AVEN_261277-1 [Araneus ventricosus]
MREDDGEQHRCHGVPPVHVVSPHSWVRSPQAGRRSKKSTKLALPSLTPPLSLLAWEDSVQNRLVCKQKSVYKSGVPAVQITLPQRRKEVILYCVKARHERRGSGYVLIKFLLTVD